MDTPKLSKDEVLGKLKKGGVDLSACKVAVLGIRGYRKRTMGDPNKNDRNIYDDAFFLVTSSGDFHAWNGNTDPSIFRKAVATLVPGIYEAENWRHKGKYAAFQIIQDCVTRDGLPGVFIGRHGINFHYGGITTWSLGCQTMTKKDFTHKKTGFQPVVSSAMLKAGVKRFTYLLIEN